MAFSRDNLLFACLCLFLSVIFLIFFQPRPDTVLATGKRGHASVMKGDIVQFTIHYLDSSGQAGEAPQHAEVEMSRLPKDLWSIVRSVGVGGIGVFTSKAGGYLPGDKVPFALKGPVSARVEVKGVIPEEFAKPAFPREYAVGLLVVDHAGIGDVDVLGGGRWGKKSGRWLDSRHCRLFQMDGSHQRLWEWVGANSALLIVTPDGVLPEAVNGGHLVSTFTGLSPWNSAYDVLGSADLDRDGKLSGKELDSFSLWVDFDSNGVVGADEVRRAGAAFDSLSTAYTAGEDGLRAPDGAVLKSGKTVGTWEFWSRGQTWRSKRPPPDPR